MCTACGIASVDITSDSQALSAAGITSVLVFGTAFTLKQSGVCSILGLWLVSRLVGCQIVKRQNCVCNSLDQVTCH